MKLKKSVALRRFFLLLFQGRAAALNSVRLLCKFVRLHGKEALILSLPTLACRSGDCPKTADIVFAIRPTAGNSVKRRRANIIHGGSLPEGLCDRSEDGASIPKG